MGSGSQVLRSGWDVLCQVVQTEWTHTWQLNLVTVPKSKFINLSQPTECLKMFEGFFFRTSFGAMSSSSSCASTSLDAHPDDLVEDVEAQMRVVIPARKHEGCYLGGLSQTLQLSSPQDHPIPKAAMNYIDEVGGLFLRSSGFLADQLNSVGSVIWLEKGKNV